MTFNVNVFSSHSDAIFHATFDNDREQLSKVHGIGVAHETTVLAKIESRTLSRFREIDQNIPGKFSTASN